MTNDKPWQLKRENNPARKGLPVLSEATAGKAVGVRLYQSDDEMLRGMNIKISDFIREAVRSALCEIRNKGN